MKVDIRIANENDLEEITELFYHANQANNRKDYEQEEVNVWFLSYKNLDK